MSRNSPPQTELSHSTRMKSAMPLSIRGGVQPYEELHLRNLLVHLLHELYYKVDQLMLQHLLGVVIRDQERDVVAL